jgi:hypothetical protein
MICSRLDGTIADFTELFGDLFSVLFAQAINYSAFSRMILQNVVGNVMNDFFGL